jgi:hypothetical protein
MRRTIDPRGFLIATAVSTGLSLVAFPFLYFNIGSIDRFHPLIFYPLCLASGVLYVMATSKRRADLSIARLGGGGALTAMIPACILTLAIAPFGTMLVEGREMQNPTIIPITLVFVAIGALVGCAGAVVWAMRDEVKFLRRNQRSDTPRALPRSRGRRN